MSCSPQKAARPSPIGTFPAPVGTIGVLHHLLDPLHHIHTPASASFSPPPPPPPTPSLSACLRTIISLDLLDYLLLFGLGTIFVAWGPNNKVAPVHVFVLWWNLSHQHFVLWWNLSHQHFVLWWNLSHQHFVLWWNLSHQHFVLWWNLSHQCVVVKTIKVAMLTISHSTGYLGSII